jgi:hypothetical protein
LKVSRSGQTSSKATVVHVMTHPLHTFLGAITSGYGRGGPVVMAIRHKAGGRFAGELVFPDPSPTQ